MFGPNWNVNSSTLPGRKRHFRALSDGFAKSKETYKGIIPRAISDLLKHSDDVYQTEGVEYSIYCSFIQIYNEKLFDLLQDKDTTKSLNIREDKYEGIFVEGLTEYQVHSVQDCFTLLKRGEKNRVTRQTKANIQSSRSHTIFQLLLESTRMDANGNLRKSKLNLCDLAGSEKIQTGEKLGEKHMEEHKSINLSLSTLGKVISKLGKSGANRNIPYRESKLTRILRDCFGDPPKTHNNYKRSQSSLSSSIILIATLSPMDYHLDETISTLKFADNSKKVLIKKTISEISGKETALVQKLRREVQYLKEILHLNRSDLPPNTPESFQKLLYLDKIAPLEKEMLALKEENMKLQKLAERGRLVEKLEEENLRLRERLGEGQEEEENMTPFITEVEGEVEPQQEPVIFGKKEENQDLELEEISRIPIEAEVIEEEQSSGSKPQGVKVMSPFVMTPLHEQRNIPVSINIGNTSMCKKESVQDEEKPELKVAEVVSQFNSWSLKGELVNNGRCPKCTLKLPCNHYKSPEEIQSDPSNFPKKQNSLFIRTNNATERRSMISRETTKDYSSVHKNFDSDRSKDMKFFSRRQLDISTNNDEILDEGSHIYSDEENKSIFTQKAPRRNPNPLKKLLNSNIGGDKSYAMKSPISTPPQSIPGVSPPGTMTNYQNFKNFGNFRNSKDFQIGQFSQASNAGDTGKHSSAKIRIRDKNNQMHHINGNLNLTMTEHQDKLLRNKKQREVRAHLKKIKKIERYREERLFEEIQSLEEQQRQLDRLQRKEIIKERKRRNRGKKLKIRLEQMRMQRFEQDGISKSKRRQLNKSQGHPSGFKLA